MFTDQCLVMCWCEATRDPTVDIVILLLGDVPVLREGSQHVQNKSLTIVRYRVVLEAFEGSPASGGQGLRRDGV